MVEVTQALKKESITRDENSVSKASDLVKVKIFQPRPQPSRPRPGRWTFKAKAVEHTATAEIIRVRLTGYVIN